MTKKITYENLKEKTFVIICGFGPEKKKHLWNLLFKR